MASELKRDLTTLEYAVLGLIGRGPQSGYSIISALDSQFWSSTPSPGSVYPVLKRLEGQKLVEGQVEMASESRSRKMYVLTSSGEEALDSWLRSPVTGDEVREDHNTLKMKFLFAETRLETKEIVDWLESYEVAVSQSLEALEDTRTSDHVMRSLHELLILEATVLEYETQQSWVEVARQRIMETSPGY